MSNKPLVSVIIPFLNTEEFIQEAIESVFAQTYDNWELLLVKQILQIEYLSFLKSSFKYSKVVKGEAKVFV